MKLPAKCHRKHGAIYYVHRNKWTRIADGDASLSDVYAALAEIHKPTKPYTINDLLDAYIRDALPEKKPATRQNYLVRLPRLRQIFGHMAISDLETAHVAHYLELRKRQGNGPGANREVAILSAAYRYGLRNMLVKANPCRGVPRNTETPRNRFIRDDEWASALARAPLRFRMLLQAAELTGFRQGDLRALTWDQVTAAGLVLEESKTGKTLLMEWSEELSRLFYLAAMLDGTDGEVFRNKRGEPWGVWAIQSAMSRLGVTFTFHDIRARAESIHPKGLGLLARYKRARVVTPSR